MSSTLIVALHQLMRKISLCLSVKCSNMSTSHCTLLGVGQVVSLKNCLLQLEISYVTLPLSHYQHVLIPKRLIRYIANDCQISVTSLLDLTWWIKSVWFRQQNYLVHGLGVLVTWCKSTYHNVINWLLVSHKNSSPVGGSLPSIPTLALFIPHHPISSVVLRTATRGLT